MFKVIGSILALIYAFLISPPILQQQPEFNYYDFALIKCDNNATEWTIHGLWPQYNGYTCWPEYCKGNIKLDIKKLKELMPVMNRYWYSCYGNDIDLWKHEWAKHGTCTGMSELEYFNTTLSVYNNYYESYLKHVCSRYKVNCIVPFPKHLVN